MSKLIHDLHFAQGDREVYEDRVATFDLQTPAGLSLTVAVVADGVGGSNRGERAAQEAIDRVKTVLSRSKEKDPVTLLYNAVVSANHVVHGLIRETQGASCTLAIAMVVNQDRLYVANVGDSRVYLLRNGNKLTQLTVDHTFANIMPIEGKMRQELAQRNPRAEAVMRAIGPEPQVDVDLGIHMRGDTKTAEEYEVAQERGKKGLPIKQGDSILVCSDGLIKLSRVNNQPLITENEIVEILSAQEGKAAARALVSFPLGRDGDDNISAAIIQTPDPNRVANYRVQQRKAVTATSLKYGLPVLALLLILFGVFYFRNQGTVDSLAEEIAQVTADAEALAGTLTAIPTSTSTPTPTPSLTPTARPPRQEGQIAVYFSGNSSNGNSEILRNGDEVPFNERTEIQVNHADSISLDASLYTEIGSSLQLRRIADSDQFIQLDLAEGSQLFIETGSYAEGVETYLSNNDGFNFSVADRESCMSIDYNAGTVTVGCFSGTCRYNTEGSIANQQIDIGTIAIFDLTDSTALPQLSVLPSSELVEKYATLLAQSDDGLKDLDLCVHGFLPTPTPTPTATPVVLPTRTPEPYNGSSFFFANIDDSSSKSDSGTLQTGAPSTFSESSLAWLLPIALTVILFGMWLWEPIWKLGLSITIDSPTKRPFLRTMRIIMQSMIGTFAVFWMYWWR